MLKRLGFFLYIIKIEQEQHSVLCIRDLLAMTPRESKLG